VFNIFSASTFNKVVSAKLVIKWRPDVCVNMLCFLLFLTVCLCTVWLVVTAVVTTVLVLLVVIIVIVRLVKRRRHVKTDIDDCKWLSLCHSPIVLSQCFPAFSWPRQPSEDWFNRHANCTVQHKSKYFFAYRKMLVLVTEVGFGCWYSDCY